MAVLLVLGTLAVVIERDDVDPLLVARSAPLMAQNREATVPPMCYTATESSANPCWACHTVGALMNLKTDVELQKEYAFSKTALTNAWANLFVDRSAAVAAQSDEDILRWVKDDNLPRLSRRLAARTDYEGYRPDLDFHQGFDADGFARDGSGWRAIRYKPFVGTFWPTNGSTGDVYIRLPPRFRVDAQGRASKHIAQANFAILEAALATPPDISDQALERETDLLDEALLGTDLDRDGVLRHTRRMRGLPKNYVGGARDVVVTRGLYPQGVEFLHPVRYLDPDAPSFAATRLKELRYALKGQFLDLAMLHAVSEEELERKEAGKLPRSRGTPEKGYLTEQGWVFQAFIEDAEGELRLQTHEEHQACLGCHTGLGVTQDSTFSFPRKVPGAEGFRPQSLVGMPDVPQHGHPAPEVLTYLRRARGGDELRANREMLERFFSVEGTLDEHRVRKAGDLAAILLPSRARALALDKAYRLVVREQSFRLGRDVVIAPPQFVHRRIENGTTGLSEKDLVFSDGTLFLDWQPSSTAMVDTQTPHSETKR
jgi:hypothetical protein